MSSDINYNERGLSLKNDTKTKLEDDVRREIIETYDFYEKWVRGELAYENFDPNEHINQNFVQVISDGQIGNFRDYISRFEQLYLSDKNFMLNIDNIDVRNINNVAIATFNCEDKRQNVKSYSTVTAIFIPDIEAPNNCKCIHIHETTSKKD
ncbi:MAG: hypothetical protein ACXAC7_11765 [Candidatus Hodarchaeales archaeon]|jgi:hypothetical protein